jgi:hypothetical protein
MSPGEVAAILFTGFALLVLLRVPVAFALGLACIPVFIDPRLRRQQEERHGQQHERVVGLEHFLQEHERRQRGRRGLVIAGSRSGRSDAEGFAAPGLLAPSGRSQ